MTWIKICGITNVKDALEAISLGADALGFIFAPSPRRLAPDRAQEIIGEILSRTSSRPCKVGVFVNEEAEEVRRIAVSLGLDAVQLHGDESPEYCRGLPWPVIKTFSVKNSISLNEMEKYPLERILLDAYVPGQRGGGGRTFPWQAAVEIRRRKNFILSGGLHPGNVGAAIRLLKPLGVDVSSGVEKSPGIKDHEKMRQFVEEVRKAERAQGPEDP